jgi:tRNA 2-thiouridine synthesizing protein A
MPRLAMPEPIILDLSGLKCPLPTLRTAKALKSLVSGDILSVTCTDPMAAIDIPNLLRETGHELAGQREQAGKITFDIRKA